MHLACDRQGLAEKLRSLAFFLIFIHALVLYYTSMVVVVVCMQLTKLEPHIKIQPYVSFFQSVIRP